MTILAQIFLAFSELKFATNCTIKHKYTDENQCGNTTEYRRLVIVFAAIDMPYFKNCRTFQATYLHVPCWQNLLFTVVFKRVRSRSHR